MSDLAKKVRKEMRRNGAFIAQDFARNFDIKLFVRKKPFLIPRILWNILLNWLFRKPK